MNLENECQLMEVDVRWQAHIHKDINFYLLMEMAFKQHGISFTNVSYQLFLTYMVCFKVIAPSFAMVWMKP